MNEERLSDAFGALRRSEAARAPRFERLWRNHAAPRRGHSLAIAFTMLLLIAVLTIGVLHRPRQTPPPSISAWRAPTDFLLDTPGRQLLNSVPDLKGKPQ